MLAVSMICRYVNKGNFGCAPKRRGGKAIVSVEWKQLSTAHINMTQVSTTGEADIMTIKATILASVIVRQYLDDMRVSFHCHTSSRQRIPMTMNPAVMKIPMMERHQIVRRHLPPMTNMLKMDEGTAYSE
jgi:hypothetical protein